NHSGIHRPIKDMPGFFASVDIKGTIAWDFNKNEEHPKKSGIYISLQGGIHIGKIKSSYDLPNWKVYPK
ncbi:hypothetical protein MHK_000336, partial [Candidatus Magnetomorum sp. HK-1]